MKESIQPKDYRFVVFADEQAKFSLQISSASHPFFTGEEKIIDTEGRVDRFKARAKKAAALRSQLGNKVAKAQKEAAKKAEKADK